MDKVSIDEITRDFPEQEKDVLNCFIQLLGKRSFVQGHSVIKRLQEKLNKLGSEYSQPDIKAALSYMAKENVIVGVAMNGEPLGKVSLGTHIEIPKEAETSWQRLIEEYKDTLSETQRAALLSASKSVDDLDARDQKSLLEGLQRLNAEEEPHDHYILSARLLLGSSKALDALGNQVAEAFGVTEDRRSKRQQYVLTAGPENPESVVFIENMSVFTEFSNSETVKKIAAICTFGYGLSMDNIGRRLIDGTITPCPAVGPQYDLQNLLESVPLFFWGDLDREGIGIFLSLQKVFPQLKLSATYKKMAERISDPKASHPYGLLARKVDQRFYHSESPLISRLIDLSKERGIDQEAICWPWPDELIAKPLEAVG